MIQVRRRADLREQGLLIPIKLFKNGGEVKCYKADEWMLASQPDELDDSEYNLVIYSNTRPVEVVGTAISIDFEFGEEVKL